METIGELVKKAVEKYFIYNGKKYLPEYIFFYRDGVSDGHIPQILEFETNSILHGLSTLGDGNYKPKFAEIIVTKRIDDRIFSMNANKTQIFNPPAGTLVAQGITSNHFDFLLTAQNVTQGTCTPTRYNVIYDTTGLPAEVFYQMTFYQCYNYYNWSGGIRVPSVVMYAHKLAYLIGQTVKSDINSKLEDSLSLHFM
jgi:aubergine-like protein